LRGEDIKEDMDLAVSLEDSLKQPCRCWKSEQRPSDARLYKRD
jgi:hypothetical protein